MRTISDFKKKLHTGVKIHTIWHTATNGSRDENGLLILHDEDRGIREVSKVQTNSFALKTTKKDGSIVDSWCAYPKASACKIIDENTIQIFEGDFRTREKEVLIPVLTYKFV